MKVARHIIIHGMVQGVGYRFFCRREAAALGINGYVKNLFNGDVEVVAEGEEDVIKHFITVLKKGPHFSQVEDLQITDLPSEERYKNFHIEF
jgi:acylphosphatase